MFGSRWRVSDCQCVQEPISIHHFWHKYWWIFFSYWMHFPCFCIITIYFLMYYTWQFHLKFFCKLYTFVQHLPLKDFLSLFFKGLRSSRKFLAFELNVYKLFIFLKENNVIAIHSQYVFVLTALVPWLFSDPFPNFHHSFLILNTKTKLYEKVHFISIQVFFYHFIANNLKEYTNTWDISLISLTL